MGVSKNKTQESKVFIEAFTKDAMGNTMRGSRKFSQRGGGVGGGGGPSSQKGSDGKFQHGKN